MSLYEVQPRLIWNEVPKEPTTSLPFLVRLKIEGEDGEPLTDYSGEVTIQADTTKICFFEGFERRDLGLWQPAFLPGHYEHGFDSNNHAPGSTHSLFLKGGNDSNFGMTLKLPAPGPAGLTETSPTGEYEWPEDMNEENFFDGHFRPDAVGFHVRTDNERADAGHFILGESNEVNKRVAQFQFTKDGKMGLLGTGGATHGATPYMPNTWYFIELRFDWVRKTVAFYVDGRLCQRQIPFRRETSSFIGACALGNRDVCTTWFDSIQFVKEMPLFSATVSPSEGVAEAWIGPLRDASAREGFFLRATDCAGHVSELVGPFYPLCKIEGAQRVSINNAALNDFTALLGDESSSDIVFVVDGRDIHAHRCILTARCEAFRVMFNSQMREGSKECCKVEMHEVGHAAFLHMLKFIYGGAVNVPEEIAVELLGLADRYLLDALKLLCGFALQRMVSVESVARILLAADRWDTRGSRLKALCMDFILANYEVVVESPVFDELAESPHLLLEIARAAVQIVKSSKDGAVYNTSDDGLPHPAKRPRRV